MKRRELVRRNIWFVLRHAPRDRRVRGMALGAALRVVYVGTWAWYELHTLREGGVWAGVFAAVMGGLGLGCVWLIRRNHAKADEGLLRLTSHPVPDVPDVAQERHGRRLAEHLLRVAVLCDRAGAEVLHKQGEIAEEHRGIARRRTLDLARRPGVWEGFKKEERDLLMAAEGAWRWEDIGAHLQRVEDVRVLRWALRLDEVLTPFAFLDEDFGPVLRTTTQPGDLGRAACREPYDLRPARDEAQTVMVRCLAEGVRRGFYQEPDEERRRNLVEAAEEFGRSPSDDLYVGEVRVVEATQAVVERMAQAAVRRVWVLRATIEYLRGVAEVEFDPDAVQERDGATADVPDRIRKEIRHVLLTVWDPIGVADEPCAQDEYDIYVEPVYELLLRGAPEAEMATYLGWVVSERMGFGREERSDHEEVVRMLRAIRITA